MRPLVGEGRISERGGAVTPAAASSWADGAVRFDHRSWSCADAEMTWTAPHHLIVLTETGGTAVTEVRVDGRRAYDGCDRPGALTFIPAGATRTGAYRRADLGYAAMWIDPAIGERLAGSPVATPAAFVNGEDVVIAALMGSLRDETAAGREPGAAYVEHLVALILLRLSALDGAAPRPAAGGTLSGRALRRVTDHIDDHIAENLSLTELARIAGMPVDRFARRFRAATGLAPYAYVLERRIRAAERQLAGTDRPIAAIALGLGFSGQSHFTTVFRERAGMTPAAFRRRFGSES